MKKKFLLVAAIAAFSLYGCQKDSVDPQQPGSGSSSGIMQSENTGNSASAPNYRMGMGSPNGKAGVTKAYYDSELFNINFMALPEKAAASIIAQNKSLNNIYICDAGKVDMMPLIAVIDAIPGKGMNALWREVMVVFAPGLVPHQFFSDEEIMEAASLPNPEIRLVPTDEVYRNSVIGPKVKEVPMPTVGATGPELMD